MLRPALLLIAIAVTGLATCVVRGASEPPAAEAPVAIPPDEIRVPTSAAVATRLAEYASRRGLAERDRTLLAEVWQQGSDAATRDGLRLQLLLASVAPFDPQVATLLDQCASPLRPGPLPDLSWLESADTDPLLRTSVRQFVGAWLLRQGRYDESLQLLQELPNRESIDPTSLTFDRGICQHQLVQLAAARASFELLLADGGSGLPDRHARLAQLLLEDSKSIEAESLDEVGRRMSDIERRLRLQQADKETVRRQQQVLAMLDKTIEELEEEQKKRQQQQQSSPTPGGQPMDDSRIVGGGGAGEVKPRDIGRTAGWGDLPAKQRDRILQQISREFPAHYRDLIEAYYRQLSVEPQPVEEK